MGDKYKKNKGSAGLEGIQFQLDLLIVFLLNAFHSRKDWKISSENQDAGKYDDLVLELPDQSVLLQAKSKQNRKINRDQLFSSNSKNVDFSLAKYFLSYLEIAPKFRKKTVIICTNTGIDENGMKKALIPHCVDSNSMLYYEGAKCQFFTVNKSVVSELKASAEDYLKKNLQGKGIDGAAITEENVEEFLENLQIFCNYPIGEQLHKIIDQLLSRLDLSNLWCETSYHEIYRKVEDWFKQPNGEYLTECRVKAMLCEIKSEKYCESLKNYNVRFERNEMKFAESSRIFHVKTDGGCLLPTLKIFCALQSDKSNKLYVSPEESIKVQKQIVEAFEQRRYTYLIVIWNEIKNKIAKKEMSLLLKAILEREPYKKVILVAESNSELARHIGLTHISQVDGSEMFEDLSKDSREKLLRRKNIVFQGKTISVKELLVPHTTEDYAKSFDSAMLEKLIRGEEIKVGAPPLDLDDTAWYYVTRVFERDIDETQQESETFSEESIFDVSEKVIIISDSAGMGKSTVLTNMAACIKAKYPRFWVIRINLNDYTRFLRDSLKKNKKTISATELLNSRETTKLSSRFERFVFSMNEKVVLMLDGVDEISPEYTGLILRLLGQCREASNVKKIFVTTRPHMAYELRAVLEVGLFKMLPFTRSNQIDFLTRYWSYNLRLDGKGKDKVEWYAEDLIDEMSLWMQLYCYGKRPSENPFAEIPMQLKMVAEIFQGKCGEYLNGNGIEPKLLEGTNLAKLYEAFIEKKRDVFVDKGNPSGNAAVNKALVNQFEECLACHRRLAVQVIVDNTDAESFGRYRLATKDVENLMLNIGIIQRLGDGFQFVHKTFAEYFVAEYIVREMQLRSLNVDFQKFLLDKILQDSKYGVICDFLDSLLQKVVHSLPSNVFESYYTYTSDGADRGRLVFQLSKGGWVSILQLVLKSVDFKIIRGKKISVKHLKRKKRINTLNDLRFLVRKAGINITNESGDTPLHNATANCHLNMTRFLIEQGADVNIGHSLGNTPLHVATIFCFSDILKCLVERDSANDKDDIVDFNVRNNEGHTALYFAVESNTLDTVKYLVEKGADVTTSDIRGRTPLHIAVHECNLKTVAYLVTHGADVNVRDNKGHTPLYVAAVSCELDAVEYLVGHGANVNIGDHKGRTPLHVAVDRCKMDVVEYLIACGANCHVRNKDGHTALHLAALAGGSGLVKFPAVLEVVGSDDTATSDREFF
ncbi:uncharacterized protein LOC108905920 [Anoplophora glabripennis]|uniref:uncharacterized protein LOC108905920 n=1 Tax=Anoplophora glabripennis TaxID=217634 RepID=UPI000875238F|nr:uncharacterized protein LOC108905920 [Anoplophora glabripennis]